MDSARLGRVLGRGARGAAKTLIAAADAASAPSPRANVAAPSEVRPEPAAAAPQTSAAPAGSFPSREAPQPSSATRTAPPRSSTAGPHRASAPDTRRGATASSVPSGFGEGSRRFRSAVAQPVRRLSGVLWLEFTGVFFGLFAISAAIGAYRLYGNAHATGTDSTGRNHFLFAAAIALVFAYFCVSSFIRAGRRSRQA